MERCLKGPSQTLDVTDLKNLRTFVLNLSISLGGVPTSGISLLLRRQAAFRSFPNKEAGAGNVHLNMLIVQTRSPLKRFPDYKFGALVDLSDSETLDSRRRSFCETFRWQAFEFSSNKLKAPADGNTMHVLLCKRCFILEGSSGPRSTCSVQMEMTST